ncbi:hypothetical protein DIDNDMLP_00179 [Klebsiella phage KP13-7]|nr:hypothetical protein DIDNDMLP_00179 [Klebsiella phage KP13-7]
MKPNNVIVNVPEFHNVVVQGKDYMTLGCCGYELFTVLKDHKQDDRHHVIVQNNGYLCTIDNSTNMLAENPTTIQKYLIENHGNDAGLFSFSDMTEEEANSFIPIDQNKNAPVVFLYEDDAFIYRDKLCILINGEEKSFHEISADKKYIFTVVLNRITEVLMD